MPLLESAQGAPFSRVTVPARHRTDLRRACVIQVKAQRERGEAVGAGFLSTREAWATGRFLRLQIHRQRDSEVFQCRVLECS